MNPFAGLTLFLIAITFIGFIVVILYFIFQNADTYTRVCLCIVAGLIVIGKITKKI